MTQALFDSILLALIKPVPFAEITHHNCISPDTVQAVFETVRFGLPRHLPETLCIDEFKGNSGLWSARHHRWYRNNMAKKTFPDANIIDPYHVIKRLDDMVDDVRLRYQRCFQNAGATEGFRTVKGITCLLTTKEFNQKKYW